MLYKLTFLIQYFIVATSLHNTQPSLNMLMTLDDLLVKYLGNLYNKVDTIKLYENISTYDFHFRHLVHRVVNNDGDSEAIAETIINNRLPKFTNICCTDEEFKKKYSWPDDEYKRLHELFQRIETLKEILISHYYDTWVTTGTSTTRQTQPTKSLLEQANEFVHKLRTVYFQPYHPSILFEVTPNETIYEYYQHHTPAVWYYGHVDYDNSL